jgi:thiol:disulfide interchange protein
MSGRGRLAPVAGLIALLAGLFWSAGAGAQPVPGGRNHVAVQLVASSKSPAPGGTATLAIVMTPEPGWHGYWSTPGDAGLPAKLDWRLPAGVEAGEPRYPAPSRLSIDGLMNYVYDKPYALLAPLRLDGAVTAGTPLPLALTISYLACTREACLPETASVSTTLIAGDGAADAANASRFAAWEAALPRRLARPATHSVENGRLRIAIPYGGDLPAKPYVYVDATDVADFAAPQSYARAESGALVMETRATATVPPSELRGLLELGDGVATAFVSRPGAVPAGAQPLDATRSAPAPASGILAVTMLAFAGALLGGLILNVMPCVFPILSLKALSLAKGGKDGREARAEALAYTGGIVLVCLALGVFILTLRAAGTQVGWAFQLQSPAVVFGLILLVGAIAFNLAGLFEFSNLSVGQGLTAQSGLSGAFWTGALAAFVATPCTGPFMAAALGAALVLPAYAALLIFAGLGLGLALPFLAIGFIPRLRKALPRPGPWMSTFRHVLAIPMFVTALGLIWVIGRQTGTTGILISLSALLLLGIGLWIMGLRQRGLKPWAWVPATVAAVLALGFAPLLPGHASVAAEARAAGRQPFDPAKLAQARADGKPVFLYLTADWCLTCKVNEKAAIERAQTQAAFARAGVITMVGDWSDGNATITRFLADNGRSGVPLYLWYAPGKPAQVLPQILTPALLIGYAENK